MLSFFTMPTAQLRINRRFFRLPSIVVISSLQNITTNQYFTLRLVNVRPRGFIALNFFIFYFFLYAAVPGMAWGHFAFHSDGLSGVTSPFHANL